MFLKFGEDTIRDVIGDELMEEGKKIITFSKIGKEVLKWMVRKRIGKKSSMRPSLSLEKHLASIFPELDDTAKEIAEEYLKNKGK